MEREDFLINLYDMSINTRVTCPLATVSEAFTAIRSVCLDTSSANDSIHTVRGELN